MNWHKTIYFLDRDYDLNRDFINSTTLESFLRSYCEGDPARAWYLRPATDGTCDLMESNPNGFDRRVDTFDSVAEADEALLQALYWNYCNACRDLPSCADTEQDLIAHLQEEGVDYLTKEQLEALRAEEADRKAKAEAQALAKLQAMAGEGLTTVFRTWWQEGAAHPAPAIVLAAKQQLGLSWRQVRNLARG